MSQVGLFFIFFLLSKHCYIEPTVHEDPVEESEAVEDAGESDVQGDVVAEDSLAEEDEEK